MRIREAINLVKMERSISGNWVPIHFQRRAPPTQSERNAYPISTKSRPIFHTVYRLIPERPYITENQTKISSKSRLGARRICLPIPENLPITSDEFAIRF